MLTTPAKIKLCIPGAICLTAFVDRDKDPTEAALAIEHRIWQESSYALSLTEMELLIAKVARAQREE